MSYEAARLGAVREAGRTRLNRLIEIFDPEAPTVFLLPGGMGSELDRSTTPYVGNPMPVVNFEEVWIDYGLALGDGKKLEIDANGHDIRDHIVVPTRPFSFVIEPYGDTETWARAAGYNYEVFPFDWRRSLEEGAYHLNQFLLDFRDAVQPRYGIADPLASTTLVCHSQGGLVALTFMQLYAELADALRQVVTVGTPFYGTLTHMRRYFMGEDFINSSSANGDIKNVARIIATLPGPYTLMPLDHASFQRDGAAIGLSNYPVQDNRLTPFDPYDPANSGRYPGWVQSHLIAAAKKEMDLVRTPLPPTLSNRLFHIRANKDNSKTELEWLPLPSAFDPDVPGTVSPVLQKRLRLGGDGTVPAWSAFLPGTPRAHCVTLPTADGHLGLLEHAETLAVLDRILSLPGPATRRPAARALATPAKPKASQGELDRLYAAIAAAPRSAATTEAKLIAALKADTASPDPVAERTWRGIANGLIAGR